MKVRKCRKKFLSALLHNTEKDRRVMDFKDSLLMYVSNSPAVPEDLPFYRSLTAQIEDTSVTQGQEANATEKVLNAMRQFVVEECAAERDKMVDQNEKELVEQFDRILKGARSGTEKFQYETTIFHFMKLL